MPLTQAQESFRKKMLNSFNFGLYTLLNVPAGWVAGMRLKTLTEAYCETTIPFLWINKNPFKSIYFAVQSMAAELSTAAIPLMAVQGIRPTVAFIIVGLEAEFHKKATGKITFTCHEGQEVFAAVDECIKSGNPSTVKLKTVGRMDDGTEVSTFYFTWSFKQRIKKN